MLAQPHVADLHHDLQPAVTVGRGVPTQQHATQPVLGHAQCDIVAGSLGGLHRLLARAQRGVIGQKHPVVHSETIGPGDDTGEGCLGAASGHRDGVVQVLPPPRMPQPPPSHAAPCQLDRQR
jgi:hypothetical protein